MSSIAYWPTAGVRRGQHAPYSEGKYALFIVNHPRFLDECYCSSSSLSLFYDQVSPANHIYSLASASLSSTPYRYYPSTLYTFTTAQRRAPPLSASNSPQSPQTITNLSGPTRCVAKHHLCAETAQNRLKCWCLAGLGIGSNRLSVRILCIQSSSSYATDARRRRSEASSGGRKYKSSANGRRGAQLRAEKE